MRQNPALLVVSDTGPLISLAVVDKLSLLETFYGNIIIPVAVWDELQKYIDILSLPSLYQFQGQVVPLTAAPPDYGLDDGETEAIELFEEKRADRLLVDDKAARRVAESRHIPCIGALGILARAKDQGLVNTLSPLFETLLEKGRYYSISLLNQILTVNGEEPLT
jgi:predicted nucleic acid-binding protein